MNNTEIAIEQEEKEQGLADEVERLQRALDDLLETCELNGMHGNLTYQQCKAIYKASVTPNGQIEGLAAPLSTGGAKL